MFVQSFEIRQLNMKCFNSVSSPRHLFCTIGLSGIYISVSLLQKRIQNPGVLTVFHRRRDTIRNIVAVVKSVNIMNAVMLSVES